MSSLSKNKLSLYAGLSRGKLREKSGMFIVEGRKSVSDSLPLFDLEAIVCLKGSEKGDWVRSGYPIYEVIETEMRKISSLSTVPEVLAIFRLPHQCSDYPKPDKERLYLLLDSVRDPGNFGTIMRTAHWFGITRIYASKDCVDLYNPKTIQSTMGSLGRVEVVYCDLAKLIAENPDMPVYGTLLDGENIYKATLSGHGFIVMGNEGKGISEGIRDLITNPLLIPPYYSDNHAESLNVAAATSAVLALFRARRYV